MIDLNTLLAPELTAYIDSAHFNKKKALEKISQLTNDWDDKIKYPDILEALQQREKIGHTAIGHGVAIPHARIPHLKNSIIVILSLKDSINFSLQETMMVDLVFGLLVPKNKNDEHLNILSALTEKISSKIYRDSLRHAKNQHELYYAVENG